MIIICKNPIESAKYWFVVVSKFIYRLKVVRPKKVKIFGLFGCVQCDAAAADDEFAI